MQQKVGRGGVMLTMKRRKRKGEKGGEESPVSVTYPHDVYVLASYVHVQRACMHAWSVGSKREVAGVVGVRCGKGEVHRYARR